MNRRDFFNWFRAAPVALPAMAASALAGDGVSLDGSVLTLGGEKVLERLPDGTISVGPHGNIKMMPMPMRRDDCDFNYELHHNIIMDTEIKFDE